LNPILGFFVTHGLPPRIARRDERLIARNSKRESGPSGPHQFRHRMAVTSDYYRLTLLYEFQQAGKLGLSFVNVHLHFPRLVQNIS
jgi:hypothetical protein